MPSCTSFPQFCRRFLHTVLPFRPDKTSLSATKELFRGSILANFTVLNESLLLKQTDDTDKGCRKMDGYIFMLKHFGTAVERGYIVDSLLYAL
jgi:hypothetical protein